VGQRRDFKFGTEIDRS